MSIFYKSERIGKNGRPFFMLKFKTLKDGIDKKSSFADKNQYIRFGKFLRKYKLDEFPQLWNLIKRDMNIVGPRPEERKNINILPKEIKDILLSVRPGLTSLSSIHFFDEEFILQQGLDRYLDYWTKVKPAKILLDTFYIQNKSFLLDIAVVWATIKRIIREIFSK